MAKIAIFGGSFNPPHVAHPLACLYVLETAGVDEVWVMPTFRHPFNKTLLPFEHRFEMARLAMEPLRGVIVSRVEADLGGESRTLHTIKHLREQHPEHSFTLVIGADLLGERHTWYGWAELRTLVDFFVLGRAGYEGPEPALPEVSSSAIRQAIARGEDVSRLVPHRVLAYIDEKGLYR